MPGGLTKVISPKITSSALQIKVPILKDGKYKTSSAFMGKDVPERSRSETETPSNKCSSRRRNKKITYDLYLPESGLECEVP